MANTHTTLTSLFTDIADAIRAKGSGCGDTLTWDGNTEGLETDSSGTTCKISDVVPTMDDLSNGAEMVISGESTFMPASDIEEVVEGFIGVGIFMIISKDNVVNDGLTFSSRGIYAMPVGTNVSLTIPGYTGFASKIIADAFPEAIAAIDTQEDLDPELATQDDLIAQIAAALEGKTGASGGASVETSTVTIYDNDNLYFDFVSATILEGDVIDACYYSESNGNLAFDENNYLILNNVVKNSIITILMYDTYNVGTTTTGATLLMEYDFDGGGMHDFKTIFVFKVTDVSARIVLSYDGVA